jgi:hypothetical protein
MLCPVFYAYDEHMHQELMRALSVRISFPIFLMFTLCALIIRIGNLCVH